MTRLQSNRAGLFVCLWACCTVLLLGCERRVLSKEYLARVGDSYLTIETLGNGRSTENISPAQREEYVAQWVNNELLYQEARRLGIENSKILKDRILEIQKGLIVQEFLQQRIYRDSLEISEDNIRSYYEQHSSDFLLPEDLVKAYYTSFSDREKANAFRGLLLKGKSWKEVLHEFVSEPLSALEAEPQIEARYYSQQALYPQELWRVAVNLSPGEVSFPIRTQGGFYILQTVNIVRQGKRAELEMVHNEIRQRLTMELRRQQYVDLLANLRVRYPVEILTTAHSVTDTTGIEQ